MKKSNLLMALAVGLSANGLAWALRDSARVYYYPLSRNRITGHRKLNRQAQKRRRAKLQGGRKLISKLPNRNRMCACG